MVQFFGSVMFMIQWVFMYIEQVFSYLCMDMFGGGVMLDYMEW